MTVSGPFRVPPFRSRAARPAAFVSDGPRARLPVASDAPRARLPVAPTALVPGRRPFPTAPHRPGAGPRNPSPGLRRPLNTAPGIRPRADFGVHWLPSP
jgi:hypothetical protein